jgi:hypothetical protein
LFDEATPLRRGFFYFFNNRSWPETDKQLFLVKGRFSWVAEIDAGACAMADTDPERNLWTSVR